MSGLLLRNLETRDPEIMTNMFNAYIKSKIEYCSLIWSPLDKEGIDKLEKNSEELYLQNPELEHPGLLQARPPAGATSENGTSRNLDNNRRPADVYIPRWRRGAPAALDFAVTSGLRNNILNRSALDGSAATTEYESLKRSHLNTEEKCRDEGFTFIPMVCEADGGGWGPSAHKVWSVLAKQKAILAGEQDSISEPATPVSWSHHS